MKPSPAPTTDRPTALLAAPPVTGPVHDPAADAAVRADDRGHVFHSWSAQDAIDPLPLAGGAGSYFFDYAGRRYLDFSSQLVNLNLGHGHPDLIAAITAQAQRLATVQPAFANDVRGRLAALIVERAGDTFSHVFFTNGGTDAVEHAVRMARLHTGRSKVLSAYRSYHGSTAGSATLTGDPRRWGAEPAVPGGVHFLGPYLYRSAFGATTPEEETARCLAHLRQIVEFEGPHTIAAITLESMVGGSGVLPPPPGYLAGVRALCDEYGILWIADEVMVGFGRLGEWFGYQACGDGVVQPDLVTFAKGSTCGYVPLGGVILSAAVVDSFRSRPYPGGLTYSGHPLACAVGLAAIEVIERDGILGAVRDLAEDVLRPGLARLAARHECVGEVRGVGAFWAVELVRDRDSREPLVPFNATGAARGPRNTLGAGCRAAGVWPLIAGNRIHIAPPLTATPDEIQEGLSVLDHVLDEADLALLRGAGLRNRAGSAPGGRPR